MKRIMSVILLILVGRVCVVFQGVVASKEHQPPSQTQSSILPLPVSKLSVEVNLFSASSDSSYGVNDSNAKISSSRNRRSLLLNHGEIREDRRAYSSGDVIIGGLFPVHIPEDGILCGKIQIGSGMWTESLIYAVNVVNNDSRLLPNFKLGYEIRDDCSDTSRALQQTLNFINVNSEGSPTCSSKVKTVGVVGTGKSATSKAVSDLLTLFKIPQISYSASASEFSKKSRFPYFFRTVPSDRHQAQVMCDIAKKFQWNLVDIIYSDDNYGSEGREELEKNFREADICVSESLILNKHKQSTEEIVGILKKSKAEIIFTFCGKDYISRILEEANIQNMTKKTWIACDSWANSKEVIGDNKHVVEGMLGVLPMSGVDREFEKYLSNINPLKNENPFYKHTLEIHHNCTFSNSSEKRQCTSSDSFKDIIATSNTWSAFVMDSVYAFAHALDNLHKNNGSYENYTDYIKNVSFEGVTKDKFGFDSNGDPYASYEVLNLQKMSDYDWKFKKVLEWDPDEGFQKTTNSLVQWKNGQQPVGRCSKSCPAGTYQKAGKELKCCWTCETCQDKTYTKTTDEKVCKLCEAGFSVNSDHTDCIKNNVVYLEWSSTVTLFLIMLVIFSMMLTLGCLTVFVRYRDTPIIKATSTELSYVLIIGIMFSFMCTFLFMGKPTDFICNVRLVMMGVSFSIYVGTLLMKTNRISRIFNRKLSDGRPSIYLNIKYQLLFIVVIVMILVVLQGMLIYSSPSIQDHYKANTVTYIQCKHSSFAEPLAVIVYNLMLALLCGYQAFRIRKLPGQFNDSRSISFTILTCCLIWFIFLSSMFTKNGYSKSIINCIGFIANGLAALFCMFFPKIWIIYMHPEMNIRQSTINMKNASRITINTSSSNNHSIKTNGTSVNCLTNSKQSVTIQKIEDSSNEVSENFMEHLCEKEDEIALMEHERDLVLEQANMLDNDLKEMRIRHEDCIKALSKLYELECQSLQELMEPGSPKEMNVERLLEKLGFVNSTVAEEKNTQYSVLLKDLHERHQEQYNNSSSDEDIVDETTGMLEPISERRQQSITYQQTMQDLCKERQHLRYTILQQMYGMTKDDEQLDTEHLQ